MTTPLKALANVGSGALSALDRATTLPKGMNSISDLIGIGGGAAAVPTPTPPPPAPESIAPTQKAARKSQQQSFLSGVAASGGGNAGVGIGRGTGGKTLLGA